MRTKFCLPSRIHAKLLVSKAAMEWRDSGLAASADEACDHTSGTTNGAKHVRFTPPQHSKKQEKHKTVR